MASCHLTSCPRQTVPSAPNHSKPMSSNSSAVPMPSILYAPCPGSAATGRETAAVQTAERSCMRLHLSLFLNQYFLGWHLMDLYLLHRDLTYCYLLNTTLRLPGGLGPMTECLLQRQLLCLGGIPIHRDSLFHRKITRRTYLVHRDAVFYCRACFFHQLVVHVDYLIHQQ